MIKTIALLALAAVAVLLTYAATRPDSFSVQRTVSIRAGAERIHPMINDLRQFNAWNPFTKQDPQVKGRYRGAAAGPGAAYDFEGDKAGSGSVEIIASEPHRIAMKLDMSKPMEAHNKVEFTLVPRGEFTEVTWAMHGPSPFLGKLLGVFIDMDRMVGGAFDAGLVDLKARAERL